MNDHSDTETRTEARMQVRSELASGINVMSLQGSYARLATRSAMEHGVIDWHWVRCFTLCDRLITYRASRGTL